MLDATIWGCPFSARVKTRLSRVRLGQTNMSLWVFRFWTVCFKKHYRNTRFLVSCLLSLGAVPPRFAPLERGQSRPTLLQGRTVRAALIRAAARSVEHVRTGNEGEWSQAGWGNGGATGQCSGWRGRPQQEEGSNEGVEDPWVRRRPASPLAVGVSLRREAWFITARLDQTGQAHNRII